MRVATRALGLALLGMAACGPTQGPSTDGPPPPDLAMTPTIDAGGQRLKFSSPDEGAATEGSPLLRGDCEPDGSLVRVSGQFIGSPVLVACDPSNGGTFNVSVTVSTVGANVLVQAAQTTAQGDEKIASRQLRLSVCPKKTMGNIAVRADYTPDDQGEYCLIHNEVGTTYNFDVDGRVEMPDPSIVLIDGVYYATGTWNEFNFRIYKSTNLVDWTLHGYAFDNDPSNNLGNAMKIGPTRKFCHLWAPSIYRDPADAGTVYLSFTAVEDLPGFACGSSADLNTVFMTRMSTATFKNGGNFETDIKSYEYLVGGNPSNRTGCDVGAQYIIPVTGSPLIGTGTNCGDLLQRTNRFCFFGSGCNAWMALDSFIYFDPNATNRRWMLYSWIDDLTTEPTFRGNHVAARPMETNQYMDAVSPANNLIPIAYMKNDHHPLGPTPNGCFGATGPMNNYCVAEAPSAAFYNGFYYVFFSRNSWDSPAYGIYYRKLERTGSETFLDIAAKNSNGTLAWSNTQLEENTLVQAQSRQAGNGRSFGHGEFFLGPNNQPYFVFHAKVDQGTARTPYFKELRQLPNGDFVQFSDTTMSGPTADARIFLVPRP